MYWIVLDKNGWAVAHVREEWLAKELARKFDGSYKRY